MKTLSDYEQKVLNHLENNIGLTTFEAVTELYIMNVQDVIMRLRNEGYNIKKEWQISKNKTRYALYYLANDRFDNLIEVSNEVKP